MAGTMMGAVRPDGNEVVARRYCEDNGVEYKAHKARKDGVVEVYAMASKPIESISIDCEIGIS